MEWFRKIAVHVAKGVGSHWAFFAAALVVVGWGVAGPIFGYSQTWQLFINTITTIVTFLMVFIIQASQNRDGQAVQLKLDELIRATKGARTEFADLEEADEAELKAFASEFRELRKKGVPTQHAFDQAIERRGKTRDQHR
jgi:low affinity Fe/Cu permease